MLERSDGIGAEIDGENLSLLAVDGKREGSAGEFGRRRKLPTAGGFFDPPTRLRARSVV